MENEYYYAMDYSMLKRCLYSNSKAVEIVKDPIIKRKLIDGEQKYDFTWFLWEASLEVVDSLLDEEGLQILKETRYLEDKLNALLNSSMVVSTLLSKDSFCDLVVNHYSFLQHYCNNVPEDGAVAFMNFVVKNYPEQLKQWFLVFNSNAQKMIIEKIHFPFETVKELLNASSPNATEYLLFQDLRINTLADLSFNTLYVLSSKGIKIPSALLEEQEFVRRLSTMENVKNYRFLMNNFWKENDVSLIEATRKTYYDREIHTFLKDKNMLKRYYEGYQFLCSKLDQDVHIADVVEEFMNTYFHYSQDETGEFEIRKQITFYYHNHDKEGLQKFLEQESHLQLTNMVIDYHFEEVPYNFFLDLNQLVNLQEKEKTLSDEEYHQYSQLLKLDSLPYEEVFQIHEQLKKYSAMERYYDHFREAKNRVATLMQQVILNEKSIKKYRFDSLSEQEGVDIYVLDGDKFYSFVQSLPILKFNEVLKPESISYSSDGGSYSLDGSDKLNTYRDPRDYYNVIYSSFPTDQVVHMYSVDSFSKYNRDYKVEGTDRIYELYTPKDFINRSTYYDEIILSLPNEFRRDELNENLKKPELLGIYCYDGITENDVISAKNLGVGIVVVLTDSYQIKQSEDKVNLFETLTIAGKEQNPCNYLASIYVDDELSRRK